MTYLCINTSPSLSVFCVFSILVSRFSSVNYFQACTGIDDFGEAILYLEETNWDLLVDINIIKL